MGRQLIEMCDNLQSLFEQDQRERRSEKNSYATDWDGAKDLLKKLESHS